jgi:hypothetical protein
VSGHEPGTAPPLFDLTRQPLVTAEEVGSGSHRMRSSVYKRKSNDDGGPLLSESCLNFPYLAEMSGVSRSSTLRVFQNREDDRRNQQFCAGDGRVCSFELLESGIAADALRNVAVGLRSKECLIRSMIRRALCQSL